MSDYDIVSTLHAARVTLDDAHKTGDAAAVTAAAAQVAAARAAVAAALADGRVTSSKHLLDLNKDCLGEILSHLGPEDALATSLTCTTLRSALFWGGLPGPLASASCKMWDHEDTSPAKEAALRALDGMEPALGAKRLDFYFNWFDEGLARVLRRALDTAPRAARIDVTIYCPQEDATGRITDVLLSPDRAFASPPQVHVECYCCPEDSDAVLRLARAGVCVASLEEELFGDSSDHQDVDFMNLVAVNAANTLTELRYFARGTIDLQTRFPALRRLILDPCYPQSVTINMPSLTALAPLLKEIVFGSIYTDLPQHGFGFDPRLFARFVAAIRGVTRICFGLEVTAMLLQNENENLGQLSALRTLRDLEIGCEQTCVELGPRLPLGGHPRAPVAEDAITNVPLLPPLTRLAFSGATRVAFRHPLPELRVLDWRGLWSEVKCTTFNPDAPLRADGSREFVERDLYVPLAIPSAALAPNLHTLLIGYKYEKLDRSPQSRGNFDLWTLVAARTALRVVVIEHARLFCSAPGGFDTTTAGFAALLARDAKDIVSVHTHDCVIQGGHEPAVESFLHALGHRGVCVCRAGVEECLFCMLHDGAELWPRLRPWRRR